MNQEKRNKKNARYQQNLQKRYGLTKSSDYKSMCSEGIPKSEIPNLYLKQEFILTRRRGRIMSREVCKFQWTPQAHNIRKEYHATKKGIPSIPKKPAKTIEKKPKAVLLEERPYSDYHNKLVQNLYGSNTMERIAKQQAFKAAHEEKIKKLIEKLKERKMSIKLRYMQQKPYKVVISTKDGEIISESYSNLPLDKLKKVVFKLNENLSKKYDKYESTITIFDRRNSIIVDKYTYLKNPPEIKQAA